MATITDLHASQRTRRSSAQSPGASASPPGCTQVGRMSAFSGPLSPPHASVARFQARRPHVPMRGSSSTRTHCGGHDQASRGCRVPGRIDLRAPLERRHLAVGLIVPAEGPHDWRPRSPRHSSGVNPFTSLGGADRARRGPVSRKTGIRLPRSCGCLAARGQRGQTTTVLSGGWSPSCSRSTGTTTPRRSTRRRCSPGPSPSRPSGRGSRTRFLTGGSG